jgi:hypothetical protein
LQGEKKDAKAVLKSKILAMAIVHEAAKKCAIAAIQTIAQFYNS